MRHPIAFSLALALLTALPLLAGEPPAAGGTTPAPAAAPAPDRSTPLQTVRGFLSACEGGDYGKAAAYLDVEENVREHAQDLHAVLTVGLPKAVLLAPEQTTQDRIVLGEIALVSGARPVEMVRDAEAGWRFARETVVGSAEMLGQLGVPWFGDFLPLWFFTVRVFTISLWQWLGLLVLGIAAFLVAAMLQWLLVGVGRTLSGKTKTAWDDELLKTMPGPFRLAIFVIGVYAFLPVLTLPAASHAMVALLVRILFVVAGTWFVTRLVTFAAALAEAVLVRNVTDDGRIRSIKTQVSVPARIVRAGIYVIGLALVFMQFEVVRSVGVSLMASAGLAGIVLGFAAQRTIGNVFAGIQLAITQPIRIGDVVIVENEWGWIEEIGLTYVVVKIWDLRRLVLPVSYFLERPFQNWTKSSADLLGSVFIYTDYTVPVDEIRAELKRILENEGAHLWDKSWQSVLVTDMKEKTVEVRLLVSAKDSLLIWDLRCLVREKILTWLQTRGQAHMPLDRVAVQGLPGGTAPAS